MKTSQVLQGGKQIYITFNGSLYRGKRVSLEQTLQLRQLKFLGKKIKTKNCITC